LGKEDMREKVLHLCVIAVFSFIILGLFYTQILKGRYYRQLSRKNRIRIIPQIGARGRIFDRNNIVIADNRLSFDVVALPQELRDEEKVISELSDIINIDVKDIKRILKQRYIAPFAPITIKEDIPQSTVTFLKESSFQLPGIEIQAVPRRFCPFKDTAAHILGYLGRIDSQRLTRLKNYGYKREDIIGYSGIEEQYDKFLRATDGGKQIEVDHRGRFVRLLGFRHAQDGKDVKLTIDLKMQQIIEEVLAGHNGAIVIMEPNTGEVLAMASFPTFNPNIFVRRSSNSRLKSVLTNRNSPLLNRAISGQYPPGSIFKIIVAVAALELKKINLKTSFYCPGFFQLGLRRFGCWDIHDRENLIEAITHSCNVFFYHTGLLLGVDNIVEYASRFNIGRSTGIDVPYEASGILPSPVWKRLTKFKNWYTGDTVNLSVGQGDLMMTPLQGAVMISAIANGGKIVKPYLVSEIDSKAVLQKKSIPLSLNRDTIKYIRKSLRNVVASASGTAFLLSSIPQLSVAGKTGTAQAGKGRQPHAWFVGYVPSDKPKLAFCILLEHAGSSRYSCVLAKILLERLKKEGLL